MTEPGDGPGGPGEVGDPSLDMVTAVSSEQRGQALADAAGRSGDERGLVGVMHDTPLLGGYAPRAAALS